MATSEADLEAEAERLLLGHRAAHREDHVALAHGEGAAVFEALLLDGEVAAPVRLVLTDIPDAGFVEALENVTGALIAGFFGEGLVLGSGRERGECQCRGDSAPPEAVFTSKKSGAGMAPPGTASTNVSWLGS